MRWRFGLLAVVVACGGDATPVPSNGGSAGGSSSGPSMPPATDLTDSAATPPDGSTTSGSGDTTRGSSGGTTAGSGSESSAGLGPCEPMNVTFDDTCELSTAGAYWDGVACAAYSGCCQGPDCDAIYQNHFLSGDGTIDCMVDYVATGCLPDPCDCGDDEICVQSFDGTCTTAVPTCVPLGEGCDGTSCTPECEENLCGAFTCSAPDCPSQWPGGFYCYGH